MEHSQRVTNNDVSNSSSTSSNLMPNVLFREIHKNAFLKRHSSDRRTGFPRKSERVWVVFCVHDDIEPFLEIYPDQKVALTHKPEWFASLTNVLHVSPTICGHEDEFEFAITLSFQVVRLSAPSWDSMMEWVETIRNKLRELKVLCPKENIYSKMPEQKQPLLPTRDPNSPLPLPPEGPSTLLPGVELVHPENRNNAVISNAHENVRHQRNIHSRGHEQERRVLNKRVNLPERESTSEAPQSSSVAEENYLESASTSGYNLQINKLKLKKAIPTHKPSTSSIPVASNITVIQVSTPCLNNNVLTESKPSNDVSEDNDVNLNGGSDKSEDDNNDDVFSNQVSKEENSECNFTENAHYEHVFLPNLPVAKAQPCKTKVHCISVNGNKAKKTHSTSLLISSSNSNHLAPSHENNLPSTSNVNVSNSTKDVVVGNATCINISRSSVSDECNEDNPLSAQIQTKLEKVSITGLIPRVPARSSKSSFKPSSAFKDSHEGSENESNVVTLASEQVNGESSQTGAGIFVPLYNQVKKIPKGKTKNEDLRNEEQYTSQKNSPVLPKRKFSEVQVVEESLGSKKPENGNSKNQPVSNDIKVSSNINIITSNIRKPESGCSSEFSKNQVSSNKECRNFESSDPGPSTSASNLLINLNRKESFAGSNNNLETEPITAVVQPPVGVISVEDIPLIGGHQRRRRRSSSSDAVPATNVSSSRGIGGADRIRINIPNNQGREVLRNESEVRSTGSARNVTEPTINVASQSSRLTLREKQVLQLKKEMLHPGGVRLQLRRKDCTGSIALVDVLNGVWIAGWKQKEHPLLYNALHIGDQLISVGDVLVRNSAEAQKLIRNSTALYIEFIIRRVPFGNVFALQRSSEGQSLGIVQEGNTAEIKDVIPNSIAAKQGLTSKTPSCDRLSLTTWFLTEINGRPLNLFFKDNEVRDRLNAVGKEISILVQPHDFIKQIKKQLKNIRSYKDYIVQ